MLHHRFLLQKHILNIIPAMSEMRSQILVLSGPSGSGKSTLINRLLTKYSNIFEFSVSYTTRKPRSGEVNGTHYHFIDKEMFKKKIDQGDFLEYANYNDNIYGTSNSEVNNVLQNGKVCLIDVSIEGVKMIKNSKFKSTFVFIMPPNLTELEQRLKQRSSETEHSLENRLQFARSEINFANTPGNFNKVIVNDNFDNAFDELETYLKNELNMNK